MKNKICASLAHAAQFRMEEGDIVRAEQLLKKATEVAEFGGNHNDKFFSWVRYAHFLVDQNRDAEAETAFRKAIDSVPLMHFNLRHAIALRELGELVSRTGRPEEGLALQAMSLKIFEALADEVCQESLETYTDRAS
jgi:hypothetical protein